MLKVTILYMKPIANLSKQRFSNLNRLTFLGAVLLLLTVSPAVFRTKVIRQSSVSAGELDQDKALLTTYCIALDSLNLIAESKCD